MLFRSGSGKSTILQIVLRFYEITGGSAKLDGHEMKELNVNNLRKQIGYVGQLPTLFNGSVRQNILLGKQDATEEEIQAAAKNAQAHDFIMNLPDGYDTEVGPGGNLLSGGQKQRVAIARAISEFFMPLVLIIACLLPSYCDECNFISNITCFVCQILTSVIFYLSLSSKP